MCHSVRQRGERETSTSNPLVREVATDHTLRVGHPNKLRIAVSKLEVLALLDHRKLLLVIHRVFNIFPQTLCRGSQVHLDHGGMVGERRMLELTFVGCARLHGICSDLLVLADIQPKEAYIGVDICTVCQPTVLWGECEVPEVVLAIGIKQGFLRTDRKPTSRYAENLRAVNNSDIVWKGLSVETWA